MRIEPKSRCRQRGFNLVELMIGMGIGLFLLAGAITVYTNTIRSSAVNFDMTHLDQQMRGVVDVMARNLRRAGYSAKAPTDGSDISSYGQTNPFQSGGYELRLGNCDGNGVCTCVTFSYDEDDGIPGSGPEPGRDGSARELFGFRYDATADAIEMRNSGSGPPQCSETGWEDVTDASVVIDRLTFEFEDKDPNTPSLPLALNLSQPTQNLTSPPSGCPSVVGLTEEQCLQMRTIIITVDGHLAADPAITMSIRERVKVRNDRFCTELAGDC
jgi:prepilin-type N-terminal cleavage/methylation domain-containing protein